MQIKTAIRYATPLLKWTKFKRLIILNFDENMELSYSNSREVKCCSYFRNQWQWYGLIWNISNRLMFWMLDHPSWWCYFGRLWKLWRWGIAGGSRSLRPCLWRLYQVPQTLHSYCSCLPWGEQLSRATCSPITMILYVSHGAKPHGSEVLS